MHRLNVQDAGVVIDHEHRWQICPVPNTITHPFYLRTKLAVEWIVALALFLVATPLLAAMAVLAKVSSPGPALYSQTRVGRGGRLFVMYKIRTMRHNCEAATGPVWSGKDDPRVTGIGRFLRDTHLDELPQLWNVLAGSMSLIGPRPERPEVVARIEREIPQYARRLLVRPGLTGLAQVQLPADTDLRSVRQKLAYDLFYVRGLSVWLDLRIALATVLHLTGLVFEAAARLSLRSQKSVVEHEIRSTELASLPANAMSVKQITEELLPVAVSTMDVGFRIDGDADRSTLAVAARNISQPAGNLTSASTR